MQGFDKVRESYRTLKLFDVQFQKWRILLNSVVILVENMLAFSTYNIL
jgi:hypothetical protein